MIRKDTNRELVRGILRDDYLPLKVLDYTLTENIAAGTPCRIAVRLRHQEDTRAGGSEGGEVSVVVEGEGVGFVDAFCHALMAHFAREFESLSTIAFTGFSVRGKMDTSRERTGADAVGVVSLVVRNSEGILFEFEQSGRSLVAAALTVVVEAVEHFVNAERAFISVYRALVDARARGRSDLIQTFTTQLATLVTTTSYTQVIERIKREML